MNKPQQFYANGKLLLTAEYAVLDGALALCLPTIQGQSLSISSWENQSQKILQWQALLVDDAVWFEAILDLNNFELIETSDPAPAKRLQQILTTCRHLNPDFLLSSNALQVKTHLGFPKDWGLGSSSTLIQNMADWAQINAYELLELTFGGSGYDLACAKSNQPLLYQKTSTGPKIQEVDFSPEFTDEIFFLYLNQKQNSREGIKKYRENEVPNAWLEEISALTHAILNCNSLASFEQLLQKHESLVSKQLELPTVQELLFADYTGVVKSLGAWGGDFVLVTQRPDFESYFQNKGYHTLIAWKDMIKGQKQF